MTPLVLATGNLGKVRELRRLLAAHPWNLVTPVQAGCDIELPEPGSTYAENAAAKSEAVARAVGLPALGDDSGIEVIALHGWPGPRSARWLGPEAGDDDRLRGLLLEVERRTPGDRRVRYVAALAVSRPGAETVVAHGRCDGVLVEPRGVNGFGYDPAFLSDDLGVTFAEAGDEAKDRVSHRARALARLAEAGVLHPARSGTPPPACR